MSGWNHAMKGRLYTGGVRPPPPERGHQVYGGQQEVLLMGCVDEDTAPAEHPCREGGTSWPSLNSWLPICRTLRGQRNKISDTGWKCPGRSRPRMRRPDRRQPTSCQSSPWLWTNAQDLRNITHARCEPCLGPDLNTRTTKCVFKTTGKIWIWSQY